MEPAASASMRNLLEMQILRLHPHSTELEVLGLVPALCGFWVCFLFVCFFERYIHLKFLTAFSSVQFSRSIVSDSLQNHGLQHARLPCPTPRACSNLCPLSWWCHSTISSSVIPFSSCLQSFPASGFLPMSLFFASDGQNIGVSASASVLPMNIQNWFPLGWTALISLQSKGLSRVFSNTTVQKNKFFSAQPSL